MAKPVALEGTTKEGIQQMMVMMGLVCNLVDKLKSQGRSAELPAALRGKAQSDELALDLCGACGLPAE